MGDGKKWAYENGLPGYVNQDGKPTLAPTTEKPKVTKMASRRGTEKHPEFEAIKQGEFFTENSPRNPVERVNHPPHYNQHPSGIECIEVVRHYNFNIGNAIKYCWRSGLKEEENVSNKQVEDLEKAIFYLKDEIQRLRG